MSTLTERLHRLVPGEPVEVALLTPTGETVIEHGRFERAADDELHYQHIGAVKAIPDARLRYVRPVDPRQLAATYRPGDRVIVHKYASDYAGTVIAVARTRLTVQITLGVGTSRERTREVNIPALNARRPTVGALL
jgi:hypothetical protein